MGMKTPCSTCAHLTNRHDHLCPNCYYASPDSDNPQSIAEAAVIAEHKYICACGENRPQCLILMSHGFGFMQPGPPKSRNMRYRDSRAVQADNPTHWYGRCYNCQAAVTNRPPGRPKKYTDEERRWNRANAPKIYRQNLNTKVILSYGTGGAWPSCLMCDTPATRVLYVGEFGKAPIGNAYWVCRRRALKDPYWHNQFLPYCDSHEVSNIGERNKQWKALVREHNADAQARSSRTFADLERLGLV